MIAITTTRSIPAMSCTVPWVMRVSSIPNRQYRTNCAITASFALGRLGVIGGPGRLSVSVLVGAQEVQGDVRLVASHPTIVAGRDVKQVPRPHLDDAAGVHGGHSSTGHYHSHVLHWQLVAPTPGPTCSDHFQPGS